MTFIIQSLNNHERMSVEQLFTRPVAEKIPAAPKTRAISDKDHPVDEEHTGNRKRPSPQAAAYQVIEQLPKSETVLFAEQIMSKQLVTLSLQATISSAMEIFRTHKFRHLPVVSDTGRLAGMVSDRDILHHLGGLSREYRQQSPHKAAESIDRLMQSPVLAANPKTDVRHIARLFVEQRVGAMPIVDREVLIGMVTRSDILRAVMRHFVLELWA